MKLLFLAPQPFFQERGTPIAVRMALEVIAERFKGTSNGKPTRIDLLCYHEGQTPNIPGVTIHRINPPEPLKGMISKVGAGISLKKIICDLFFLFKAVSLAYKNRRSQYDLVHAVEESVFIAIIIKFLFKVPYIYDMDSSLAMQITEKWTLLKPLSPILKFLEGQAVKHSMAVAPVCDALGVIAEKHGSKNTVLLRDISLLKESADDEAPLREQAKIPNDAKVILYVGNLEGYQGIDLLIDSYQAVKSDIPNWYVLIIGGSERDINYYREKAGKLDLSEKVILLGPKPVAKLGHYIKQADILASPRTKGNNTPMKIYSYLHSSRAIIATRLPTHTQVLDDQVSMLAEPTVESYSQAMLSLTLNDGLRQELAEKAFRLAEENYTYNVFSRELNRLYNQVEVVHTGL